MNFNPKTPEYLSSVQCAVNIQEKAVDYLRNIRPYNRKGYAALEYRCGQLFRYANSISGKTLLEIGGGEGLFSLWALAQGANRAVVLEPEAEGAASGAGKRLLEHREAAGISEDNLILLPKTLQEYDGEFGPFELVLSHSSINHLDESACAELNRLESAQRIYLDLFKKISGLMRPDGFFIISDCGRANYWNSLGLVNRIAPHIEWEKHQESRLWLSLLDKVGFKRVASEWHSFYPLRFFGKLMSNSFFSRWMTSQFIITVQKR